MRQVEFILSYSEIVSKEDLILFVKAAFKSAIFDYYSGWIFREADIVNCFYSALRPLIDKFDFNLFSEVPLSHFGYEKDTRTVDLTLEKLNTNYNSSEDYRSQAIEESLIVFEFKYITSNNPKKDVKGDIKKLSLIRKKFPDIILFLIVLYEGDFLEKRENDFYNQNCRTDFKFWNPYCELHFVPDLKNPLIYLNLDE